jgi:hypothetical protein
MPGISSVDCISPAFSLMRKRLFQPFRFDYWARIAVLGVLAGELSSSGSSGHHGNTTSTKHVPSPAFPHFGAGGWIAQHWQGILLAIGAVILLGVLFTYISSVLRFVLYEAVLRDKAHIREGFMRWSELGLEYFWFRLIVTIPYAFIAIYFVGLPLLRVIKSGGGGPELFATIAQLVGSVLLVPLLGLIVAVVMVMTKDFVVPQMMFEGIGCTEGWRRLWLRIKDEPGSFAVYIFFKIVLSIAAFILFAIAMVISFVILAIPAALCVAAGVVVVKMTGLGTLAAVPLILLGVIVGVPALIFFVGFIGAPITVFFPAYSIYYFASRYKPLYDELYPPPATTQPSPS